MIKLSPSILAADPMRLLQAVELVRDTECDELHFDVMDGHFVPNLSFGPHILSAMKASVNLVYDVHLMLDNPQGFIDGFANAGADIITVHAEADGFLQCIDRIKAHGLKAGISLKPATPVEQLRPYLGLIDRVLLMTVEPGFGGQKLIPSVLDKAKALRAYGFKEDIQADGGINVDNAQMLVDAGINVLVMGTAFFGAEDPAEVARKVHAM